jgi:hypothetical protein
MMNGDRGVADAHPVIIDDRKRAKHRRACSLIRDSSFNIPQ